MDKNIKLLFAFMAVFALLSVFSLFDVIGGARSANMRNTIANLPPPQEDPDGDGLTNADESYWDTDFQNPDTDGDGTPDGEEVKLKRNPAIPAPDDNLLSSNLTQNIADIAVSGLVEGSLKPDGSNYEESLASVVLSTVDEGFESFIASTLDPSKTKTIEPTRENQLDYLESAEKIWEKFFKTYGSELNNMKSALKTAEDFGFDDKEFVNFFNEKIKEFEALAANWFYLPVPQNWTSEHAGFLNLITSMIEINKALSESKNDPLKAVMAFTLITNVAEEIPNIIEAYQDKAKKENLSESVFFQ